MVAGVGADVVADAGLAASALAAASAQVVCPFFAHANSAGALASVPRAFKARCMRRHSGQRALHSGTTLRAISIKRRAARESVNGPK